MRKTFASLVSLGVVVVALTGCAVSAPTSYEGSSCSIARDASGVDDLVAVSGDVGSVPTVEMFSPIRVASSGATEVVVGDGIPITDDRQGMVIDFQLYRGSDGELLAQSEFDGNLSRVSNVQMWANQVPGMGLVLECAKPGTRLLAALAYAEIGEQAQAAFGIQDGESIIAVIDVLKTYLPRAVGTVQFNESRGLPAVVLGVDGRPGITVPSSPPPTDLVTQVLIKGDGAKVSAGQAVRMNYTGVLWREKTVFDSSWDRGSAVFDLRSVIPGFAQALEGQPIGSQVLIVIPPELGYEDSVQGAVPANSTLVFVVDILGIDEPPAGG